MKKRKIINLFVRNSPPGAICSSVIHEWAQGKYDAVSVCYCEREEIDEKLYDLYKFIRLAEANDANPCSQREVIVINMCPCKQSLNRLSSLEGIHISVWGYESISSVQYARKMFKKYLGFFKKKWPNGYSKLYEAMNYTIGEIDWKILNDFLKLHGADELQMLFTAYLHDLYPEQMFDALDMIDYYYSTFQRRHADASSKNEHV